MNCKDCQTNAVGADKIIEEGIKYLMAIGVTAESILNTQAEAKMLTKYLTPPPEPVVSKK